MYYKEGVKIEKWRPQKWTSMSDTKNEINFSVELFFIILKAFGAEGASPKRENLDFVSELEMILQRTKNRWKPWSSGNETRFKIERS